MLSFSPERYNDYSQLIEHLQNPEVALTQFKEAKKMVAVTSIENLEFKSDNTPNRHAIATSKVVNESPKPTKLKEKKVVSHETLKTRSSPSTTKKNLPEKQKVER